MEWFTKHKFDFLALLLLGVAYLIIRLPNLNLLPIFTDEAIYMRWAQIANQDPNWRFISLTDGKQPLFIWLTVGVMQFVKDPLTAGRLVSVFAGLGTLVGLYALTIEVFKKRSIAIVAVVLYLFYPIAQVHDRMALYDSLVVTFAVWAAFISILLAKYVRLDLAYTLGFVIGAATLNKTSGFLSAYLLPVSLAFFDFSKQKRIPRLVRWGLYALLAFAISQLFYSMLRLSPYFHIISQKDATFVYPIREWIQHPFEFFLGNLRGLTTWLIEYMTIPYMVMVVISLILIKIKPKEKLFLFLNFFLPFIALALFGKVLFPRYIFFMSVMLLPLAAWSVVWVALYLAKRVKVKELYLLTVITILTVAYAAFVAVSFSSNPVTAPIAKADSRQYINGWGAGWGVAEAADFFANEAKDKKIYIGTEGTFGLMPFSLEMYLVNNKNITLKGMWPIEKFAPEELVQKAAVMPTYIVFYQPCVDCSSKNEAPKEWPLTEVKRIQQGSADSYLIIYKVNATSN
jgi:4-amino-4-deoxy-L-arabinose transferase-like glycosyltransferase